jgi:enterobactin synthetase component D / holo-[acyl-carrier protein] synthase
VHSQESNPAALSADLIGLFPPGAVAAELRGAGDIDALFPEEARHLGRSVQKRAQEFAAGRLCARRLLHEFGIQNFPVVVGEHRQPVWPDTLVGSITHTTDFCAAVVAPKLRLRALGIDCEIAGRVGRELWRSICTPAETAWLRSLPEVQQLRAASLIFSAKEAFYKCQFGATQEHLGFQDVAVEIPEWGEPRGVFRIRAKRRIAVDRLAAMPLEGRYLFHEAFVTAGVALTLA